MKTVTEAAQMLGLTTSTLHKQLTSGAIKGQRAERKEGPMSEQKGYNARGTGSAAQGWSDVLDEWTVTGFAAEQFADETAVAIAVGRMYAVPAGHRVVVTKVVDGWLVRIVR